MQKQYEIKDITEEFLKENDGKSVWIRWDYICLRGYCYYSNPKTYAILEKVEEVKVKMSENGYQFKEGEGWNSGFSSNCSR